LTPKRQHHQEGYWSWGRQRLVCPFLLSCDQDRPVRYTSGVRGKGYWASHVNRDTIDSDGSVETLGVLRSHRRCQTRCRTFLWKIWISQDLENQKEEHDTDVSLQHILSFRIESTSRGFYSIKRPYLPIYSGSGVALTTRVTAPPLTWGGLLPAFFVSSVVPRRTRETCPLLETATTSMRWCYPITLAGKREACRAKSACRPYVRPCRQNLTPP